MEGTARSLSRSNADALFTDRPRDKRVPLHAWRQDEPVASREDLEARLAAAEQQFAGVEVPRPRWWRAYRIVPDVVEFWTEDERGLHDRVACRRVRGRWRVELLAP